jgi:predicted DNA-binding transcriptional regulator AlpA
MRRLIRPKEAMRVLGIGHTKFHEDYITTGRLRAVRLGARSVAYPSDEIDALVNELIAKRDTQPPRHPKLLRRRVASPAPKPRSDAVTP